MKLIKQYEHGLTILQPESFEDYRGENVMIWNDADYSKYLPDIHFVEHNLWCSHKGTLVGIHHSPHCWKLYECLYGRAWYAFIDMETNEWQGITLTDRNRYQVIKPPCYATGLLVLSDYAVVHVMQSQYYDPEKPDQITYRYDDKRFNIKWPLYDFILSQRDMEG